MIQVTIKDPVAKQLLETAIKEKSDTNYLANKIIKEYFANLGCVAEECVMKPDIKTEVKAVKTTKQKATNLTPKKEVVPNK